MASDTVLQMAFACPNTSYIYQGTSTKLEELRSRGTPEPVQATIKKFVLLDKKSRSSSVGAACRFLFWQPMLSYGVLSSSERTERKLYVSVADNPGGKVMSVKK